MAKLVAFNASRLYLILKMYIMEYRNGVICKSVAFDVLYVHSTHNNENE